MGRRELREHIFRLLFRRDFFPEEEMKEQETFYIEYLADPEQKEVDYIVQKTEKIIMDQRIRVDHLNSCHKRLCQCHIRTAEKSVGLSDQ